MTRILVRASLLAFGCLIFTPIVFGVESSDYLESLKDDEEPLGAKEAVTEYPNGVNVIPGEADIHYPIYSKIPRSSFNCLGRRPGFYADTELRCQVWHICDESGVQQDFLCTNGTIYSQDKRVCDWWYNVNCDPEEVSRNYEQNEELYKGPPPKKNSERDDEETNDLPPPPPRKSAPPPPPPQHHQQQQRRPQPRPQEYQRNEPQQQPRQEVQPTARRIGNDERPYTVEDRNNPEPVQNRPPPPPPPPQRPAGNPSPSGTPEKKRVIVLRLPGPLPPGATIPPHILMEYAESVLAAERAGKAPPTGLHDLKNRHQQQSQQQQRPRPPPASTTQAPPPPPPPPPQHHQQGPPPAPKPRGPILPYTPRPFSTFLEQASKFNGQTKTQPRDNGEQNYNRPAQTPPPTQRPTQPPTPATQRTTQQQQNYNRVQEQNNYRSSQAPQQQRPTANPESYNQEQQRQQQQRPQQQQQNYERPQEEPQQQQRPAQEQLNFRKPIPTPQTTQRSNDDTPYCDIESGQYCGEAAYERQREERLQQEEKRKQQQQAHRDEQRQRQQERPQQQRPSQEENRQQPPRPQERPQQRPQQEQQQRNYEEPQNQQPQRPQQQRPQEDSRQQQRPQQYEEQRQQPQRPQPQRPQEDQRRDQQNNYEQRPQEQEYQQNPRPQQQQQQPRPAASRPTPPQFDDAPLPEKKVPVKSSSPKSHASHADAPQKKFRHSTPRKVANVKFAPKSQALLEEEDGGFVVEESRRPAYPFQFNSFQQQPSSPAFEPQPIASSGEKEAIHSKTVTNPFQGKPRRQKQRPQPQPEYIAEVAPTEVPQETTTVKRLVVVAKTLKIKDPRQQQARPIGLSPAVSNPAEDFPRESYEAVKIGSNYRQTTTDAPTTVRTVNRPTTTTTTTTRRPTTTATTTTEVPTTPFQVEPVVEFSTVQPVRRIIKKKKLRPITTTTTEHYDGQYVPNEPEHFFPSTEPSAFSKITEDLGLDIYGRSPDDDEEEELIRAAQLYLQASESYGKRKRL